MTSSVHQGLVCVIYLIPYISVFLEEDLPYEEEGDKLLDLSSDLSLPCSCLGGAGGQAVCMRS
jgi:hypothetical protein